MTKKATKSLVRGIKKTNGLVYLVRELSRAQARSKGGIIIPDGYTKDEWAKYGEIVTAGDGDVKEDGKFYDCKYPVGETVMIDRFTSKTMHDGEHLRIVPERHVICSVDPDVIRSMNGEV